MIFPSFAQGKEFQRKQDARIKRTNHRYKDRFTNGSSSSSSSSNIEAFSGNSNGSTAPSTTTAASSS